MFARLSQRRLKPSCAATTTVHMLCYHVIAYQLGKHLSNKGSQERLSLTSPRPPKPPLRSTLVDQCFAKVLRALKEGATGPDASKLLLRLLTSPYHRLDTTGRAARSCTNLDRAPAHPVPYPVGQAWSPFYFHFQVYTAYIFPARVGNSVSAMHPTFWYTNRNYRSFDETVWFAVLWRWVSPSMRYLRG